MKKKIDLPQVSDVTLPEVFHLRPGLYILILLTLALLLVLFFVTIFPALLKGGRYVTFQAPLAESGIYLDDTYLGSADHQFFIKTGTYAVRYQKAGVVYATTTLRVDRPLFLTAFIHRTLLVDAPPLQSGSEATGPIIRFDLDEIIRASAILTYDMVTRQAPLFENLATDLLALQVDAPAAHDAMLLALHYVSSKEMLEDASAAVSLLGDPSLESTLEKIKGIYADGGQPLPADGKTSLPSIKKTVLHAGALDIPGTLYGPSEVLMGRQSPLSYPEVKEAPTLVQQGSFALAQLPVTQLQYAHFVEENPRWARTNRAQLQEQGLVDEMYLDGIALSTRFSSNRPITNISWHAAVAFSQWLGEKSGKHVFLPTEAMYSSAALSHPNLRFEGSVGAGNSQDGSPASLLGGLWELTASPYIPLARVLGYGRALQLHSAFAVKFDPIVKGGSYLSDPSTIDVHTVGVVQSDATSELIGFRIAWEQ